MAREPEAESDNPDEVAADAGPGGSLKRTLLLALAMLFPALAGVGLGVMAFPTPPGGALGEDAAGGRAAAADAPPELHAVDPVVVNLAGSLGERFLKLEIAFEWSSAEPDLVREQLQKKKVILRDRMIALLGQKSVRALDSEEGRGLLKEELREGFDQVLFPKGGGKVGRVFFSEFIVQ